MDMMSSIASMATGMKQVQVMQSVGTSVAKKSLETMEVQAQGIIEMAQNLPKVQGQIGSLLDVRA